MGQPSTDIGDTLGAILMGALVSAVYVSYLPKLSTVASSNLPRDAALVERC